VFISQKSSRELQTVGILRGEFTRFQEPLDLAEDQEGLSVNFFPGASSGENRAIGFEPTGTVGSLTKSRFGVLGVEGPKAL
jgi:hypothetical protein